jgi:hypothetical protein
MGKQSQIIIFSRFEYFGRDFKLSDSSTPTMYGQTVTDHYFPGGLWTAGCGFNALLPENAQQRVILIMSKIYVRRVRVFIKLCCSEGLLGFRA